mmetsp:Transcript_8001/g.17217  ORF Transcript_8001/g.17217 Transcript_8001/m.17217 type:complete len:283 (+) Transcript_8001:88-936(+)
MMCSQLSALVIITKSTPINLNIYTHHMNMEPLSNNTIDHSKGELLEHWTNQGCIEKDDPMEVDSSANIDFSSALPMLNIPKPVQKLPARCYSEPISHRPNPNITQVGGLLEDWPRRTSCCSINTQDWQNLYKQLQPKVTFSERSIMHVYLPDPLHLKHKSYSKSDRKDFSTETFLEAIRIKRLIKATPGTSTKDSFKSLIKNNIISLEEIVGIEHLVLDKSARKLAKERQDHSRAVLMEQRRQHQVETMMQEGDCTRKLGEFSASRTVGSSRRARIRAAMAA